MPRSSNEKSEETRTRIREVSYHLFIERGYNATSMREISQKAGVTVGAIYNHFATKEAIWMEVIAAHHPYHEVFPVIRAAQGESMADIVRSAASGLIHELLKRSDLLNLMFIEIVEFNSCHIPDLYREMLPEIFGVADILKDKHGRLRDIPMNILVRSFLGLFFSFYITGLLGRGLVGITNDEESLRQVVDLYLFGVLADDDPARKEAARNEAARIDAGSSQAEEA